jgi:hypothetical protein
MATSPSMGTRSSKLDKMAPYVETCKILRGFSSFHSRNSTKLLHTWRLHKMIHFHIDDKLSLLASNDEELIEMHKKKIMQQAIENGHDMGNYSVEGNTYLFNLVNHLAFCRKCRFSIDIEEIASVETVHYYSLCDAMITKCDGIY